MTIEHFGVLPRKTLEVIDAYLLNDNVLSVVRAYGFDVVYELSKKTAKFRGYAGALESLLKKAKKISVPKLLAAIEHITFTVE